MTLSDFSPLHDYYYVPFWQSSWFVIASLLFLSSALGILGFFSYKRWAHARAQRSVAAHEWALGKLLALHNAELADKQQIKAFYYALTDLLKEYFYRRYAWETRDKTDEEFVALLKTQQLDKQVLEDVRAITQSVIEIKYADAQALAAKAKQDIVGAREVVKRTIPEEG